MDDILFTSEVFGRLVTDRETRLARGARLRREMHEAMKRGEKPTGYRAAFLKEHALILIHVLGEMAEDFDSRFPEDKCSVADLMDILATAAGILKAKTG